MFRVIEKDTHFYAGEIITLKSDDGSDCPLFWNADKSESYCTYWSELEPHTKSIRDVQVGDVVVDKNNGDLRMVHERFQNTVVLSQANDFKKTLNNIYHFDQLEEYCLLKAEPVVDDKTAEATRGRNDVRREKITSVIQEAVAEVLTTMIKKVEERKWNYHMAKAMHREYVLALDDVLTLLREELTKKDQPMTKQEQKDEAWEAYSEIVDEALKAYSAIEDPARKAYQAKCREIDMQEDDIKINKD